MDITDAECLLEDLVSKSCVAASPREESDEIGEEGGVPKLGEVDLRPEEGQASESGLTTCAHDVEQKTIYT